MLNQIKILLLCFFLGSNLLGQTPVEQYLKENIQQRNFDKKKWEVAKEGIDYSKEMKASPDQKDRSEEIREDPFNSKSRNVYSNMDSSLLSTIVKFLLIAAVLVILVVLIRSYLGLKGGAKGNKRVEEKSTLEIDIESVEEHIMDTDLEGLIEQALSGQNYPLAVRLYYLAALKALSIKKIIKWKKDKTNQQYLKELRDTPFFEPFAKATHLFEHAWYGADSITLNRFNEIAPQFQELVQNINRYR